MERLYFIKDIKKSGLPCNSFDGIKKYVATGDVENNKIVSFAEIDYKSKPSRANVCVSEGDVLFAKMQNTIKVIQIDTSNSDIVYSTGFYCFNDERILPSFLKHYFLSKAFNEQKDKRCNGATMKAINDDGMSELSIKLYSLDKQKEIIKILDSINSIIDADKKQIELLDELVKSRFIEMFGDINTNSYKYESGFVKDYCTMTQGVQIPMSEQINEYKDGYIRYLYIQDLKYEKSDWIYVRKNYPEKILTPNDLVVVNTGNGSGEIYAGKEGVLSNNLFKVSYHISKFNPKYMFYYFSSDVFQGWLWDEMKHGTQPHLGHKIFGSKRIIVPPIELQNEFAEFVELVDKSKFNIQHHVTLMQELLNKTMCIYFGGNE